MTEFEASLGYILRLFQANKRPLKPECAEFEEGVSMVRGLTGNPGHWQTVQHRMRSACGTALVPCLG